MTLVSVTESWKTELNGIYDALTPEEKDAMVDAWVAPRVDEEKLAELRQCRRDVPELFMDSSVEVMAKQAAFAGVRAMQIARMMGKEYGR